VILQVKQAGAAVQCIRVAAVLCWTAIACVQQYNAMLHAGCTQQENTQQEGRCCQSVLVLRHVAELSEPSTM
jgi:hypothetical protein